LGAPRGVLELAERFDRNVEAYRAGRINEENTKVSYINPLMEALGWDVRNAQGRPGGYQDVVFEDSVKIGGGTKAPDYGFYVGGSRKFFLEAKKPSVNLADDVSPAVQLRRYAWTARHPVGILTDFEELAVYDCRIEPGKDDQPATARALYLRYDEYEDRWDEIEALFGRDAVSTGSLERFAETAKSRRGTETVDRAFLREIEGWRQTLAKDLARRNALNGRQLNYAVQTTIDRIIFLRMAEDRGIEEYGRLLALTNGPNVYGRMLTLFREADDRYNSGLFHFRSERGRLEEPDDLTPHLSIDDGALAAIIRGLYYPECPYEFSVLPVDVLGQVYEQFLGSVIRLESPDQAVVEAKPEVRKAGGVYYTPTYIVDYIVGNTLGKLLEGKRPGPRGGASRLKIVDPACGSGSFLIGAYEYLLDWHRDRYVEDGPEKHHKRLYEGPGGQWLLTIDEKKRILVNNIHGVDIDPQAVEVTKLSLLLKVLEGETDESITRQLSLFAAERALPDLDANIKCGNSLIGPDFYDEPQMSLLEEEEHYRINVFDWEASFPHVFGGDDDSGFDAVIGNPPYIRIQALKEFAPVEAEHYKTAYRTAAKGNYDIYVTFIEKGLGLLNGGGRLGYIVPHKFFNAKYGAPVRAMISSGDHLSEIVHFGDEQVFTGATTYTALVFLDAAANSEFRFVKADDLTAWRDTRRAEEGILSASSATSDEWSFVAGRGAELFERLRRMPVNLGQIATKMYQGCITSADTVYLFKEFRPDEQSGVAKVYSKALGEWTSLESGILKPVVRSGSVGRYWAETTAVVLFPYRVEKNSAELYTQSEMEEHYPLAWKYLERNKTLLEEREKGKFRDSQWHRFGRTQNLGLWEQPKLMIPYMITRLSAYPDWSDNYYFINVTTGGYGITVNESEGDLAYLTSLINSRLLDFYLKQISTNFSGGYFAANKQYIEQLPIRTIDFSDAEDAERHERMVGLVERMLGLHERLAEARIERERTVVGHQISATDKQIDCLVYELYGLTDEEIAIVEEATGR
jgi:type I restriction-modification system DNA methylase subunit/predicted type IV restriction endonuclease